MKFFEKSSHQYQAYLLKREFLVASLRGVDMPRDRRCINELNEAVRDENLRQVRAIVENQLQRKDKNALLSILEGGDKLAKELELGILTASRLKKPAILRYLLQQGIRVDIEVSDIQGNKTSPLHHAVQHGTHECMTLLLKNNSNVNYIDQQGNAPLHLAVRNVDCTATRMLLSRGAEVQKAGQDNLTPLQLASKTGHVELVRILMEYNAKVFHRDQTGPSPLHIAASEGHVPLIDMFSCYVDVNILVKVNEDGDERAALHLASEQGYVETVQFLLDRFQADVNVMDSDDMTPLHCVLRKAHNPKRMRRKEDFNQIVELFISRGVLINHQTRAGETALHLAAMNGFHHAVSLILAANADTELRNKEGLLPTDCIPDYDVQMKQIFINHGVQSLPFLRVSYCNANSCPCSPNAQKRSKDLHNQTMSKSPIPEKYDEQANPLFKSIINSDGTAIPTAPFLTD